jgi:hypothetical protein
MFTKIQMAITFVALLCGVTASTARAQPNATSAATKMSNKQMMDKMNSMSTAEKAAMFDKMTTNDKMTATKMAGHDMTKMSHKEKMETMNHLSTQEKADMFDKMPMDTKMGTMRMAMKENEAERTKK